MLHFGIEKIENITIIGVSGMQPQNHGAFYYVSEAQFYHGLKKIYEQAYLDISCFYRMPPMALQIC